MVDRRSLTRRESLDPAVTMWRGALIGSVSSVAGGITTAGVDLTDRAKLLAARDRWQGALEARIFSPQERDGLPLYDDAVFCAAFGLKESVIKVLGGLPKGAGFHDIRLDRTGRGWRVSLRGHLAVFGAAAPSGSMVGDALEWPDLPPLAWAAATCGPATIGTGA
jgi:phosphopantetheinyl transferase (holo-ACP synthase)